MNGHLLCIFPERGRQVEKDRSTGFVGRQDFFVGRQVL